MNVNVARQIEPRMDETSEWVEAFEQVLTEEGKDGAAKLLAAVSRRAAEAGVPMPLGLNSPYVNTIPVSEEEPYPGDLTIERRINALVRWNAMAMVHCQNKKDPGIGGHISTYSSAVTLFEVGFNHFFRARYDDQPGDFVYFQGHASPGVYARAYLEGRLSEEHLENFRHELRGSPGLPSYPHPWLMPGFWQFPSVSMGLAPLHAIYQARFMRYLENRNLIRKAPRKIWALIGDGETDEPEAMGSLTLAAREKLDNLIFVVNCNLQRLDGPVRGNGNIIDELEAAFRGAGWNVLKVVWGCEWDRLIARDNSGLLVRRMGELVDGERQSLTIKGGAYIRKEFFGKDPELLKLVNEISDDDLARMRLGGHDPQKVYNAYRRAVEHRGSPTVILARTVKGFGVGSAEARNATHLEKKLTDQDLASFRARFDIPIPEEAAHKGTPFRPPEDSREIVYLKQRRQQLGGYLPSRETQKFQFDAPPLEDFGEWLAGSKDRGVSTTMGFVSLLRHLLKDPKIGKLIVPIIPDEARTFGMEPIIRQVGIYASQGQRYEPYDKGMPLYYREEKDGQMLEEGITEAGSMGSFMAAGTAYANYYVPTIPFFSFYSMFGFQRVGDLIWAFGDARGKGFLLGATAGRTTLSGEGLQHQDGQSLVLASTVPTCASYDPAFVYELAVVIQDGLRRMYEQNEDLFFYITLYNENYPMPDMPEGCPEGILQGIYKFRAASGGESVVQLFGSGPILNEALQAQEILATKYGIHADVWSVTSYSQLRREALGTERWNRLHPSEPARRPNIQAALDGAQGPIIAATDYMKMVPDQLSPWLGDRLLSLGTDGFGRSDSREFLRRHFEVDRNSIAAAALSRLAREGKFDPAQAHSAFQELNVDTEAIDPAVA